ncbi:MAG: hypothetical protein HOW73_19930 [Polyangiaceae bacterium]|nr:hypothetical protein [Polyangiaceae bacterium]
MRATTPFACLALLFAAAPAHADARWFPGTNAPLAATSQALAAPEVAAEAHIRGREIELGIDGVGLRATRTLKSNGGRIVRFAQTVDGVRVIGGGVVVRIGDDAVVRRIAVDVLRDVQVDTVPSLDADEARSALEDQVGSVPAPANAELVIVRIDGGRLVWQLDVRDIPGGSRYWVDAHDGTIVARFDLARDIQGRVYTMNSVESPTPTDVLLPLIDSTQPGRLNGWDGLLSVTNYVSGSSQNGFTVEQAVGPSSGQDFLYDPPANPTDPTDAFAQVNLYYHLTAVRSLFAGLGAEVDGASWKLTAVANALEDGQSLDNAFFSPMGIEGSFAAPNLIAIGQGSIGDFAYDSDVFKHEFGHYVTHNAIGYNLGQLNFDELGLSPFSGSIDEGIADYFACSDNDDAELGEASLEPLGAGRNLTNTSKTCPNDLIGEVHADGEVIGSLSWSIREAVGKEAGDQIIWGALSSMPEGGHFGDFSEGIVATANDLVTAGTLTAEDVTAVQAILADRGLDDCGRIIALSEGQTTNGTLFGLELLGQAFGQSCSSLQQFGLAMPSLFHYSWTPSAGDIGVRFSVTMTPIGGGGGPEYTIFARANDTVRFSSAGGFPSVSVSDYSADFDVETGELVIDASSDPPFDPNATYDFVVVSSSCPTLAMEASAGPFEPMVNEGGGGAGGANEGGTNAAGGNDSTGGGGSGGDGADDDEDDGCGCKTVGAPAGTPVGALLGLGALAVVVARRRRARSS